MVTMAAAAAEAAAAATLYALYHEANYLPSQISLLTSNPYNTIQTISGTKFIKTCQHSQLTM